MTGSTHARWRRKYYARGDGDGGSGDGDGDGGDSDGDGDGGAIYAGELDVLGMLLVMVFVAMMVCIMALATVMMRITAQTSTSGLVHY